MYREVDDLQEKYRRLLQQCKLLQKENEALKTWLHSHGISYGASVVEIVDDEAFSQTILPTISLSLDDKVKLFQSYFKGR